MNAENTTYGMQLKLYSQVNEFLKCFHYSTGINKKKQIEHPSEGTKRK